MAFQLIISPKLPNPIIPARLPTPRAGHAVNHAAARAIRAANDEAFSVAARRMSIMEALTCTEPLHQCRPRVHLQRTCARPSNGSWNGPTSLERSLITRIQRDQIPSPTTPITTSVNGVLRASPVTIGQLLQTGIHRVQRRLSAPTVSRRPTVVAGCEILS